MKTPLITLFVLMAATLWAAGERAAAFVFDEPPFVHPQIVKDLSTWVSDTGDQVVAINLTASNDSNRYFGEFEVKSSLQDGGAPEVSVTDQDEWFAYRYVGMLVHGVHVLEVSESTGGTGVFKKLLLLSLREDHGIEVEWETSRIRQGAPRTLLFKEGEIILGDRWSGALKVDGDRLFIGPDEAGFAEPNAGESGWLTYDAVGAPKP